MVFVKYGKLAAQVFFEKMTGFYSFELGEFLGDVNAHRVLAPIFFRKPPNLLRCFVVAICLKLHTGIFKIFYQGPWRSQRDEFLRGDLGTCSWSFASASTCQG